MRRIDKTLSNSLADLKTLSLGFDEIFDIMSSPFNPSNYPVYDLIDEGDGKSRIDIALAGFDRDNVSVTMEKNILTISGSRSKTDEKFVYNGIAKRDFTMRFPVLDSLKVSEAEFKNGILSVSFETVEDKKPKSIEIK